MDNLKKVFLLCNAHLDPVWLWRWEEGAAEAVSTFRIAADFCEKYDNFVFNHNEAILYKWVEEYEPALFVRIQNLVKQGKWHIMGGWFIQPDCNMPSGESFVRQILVGLNYFKQKFNTRPTTAINFDSFGHTRGLVQILKKSGYNSYVFMRAGNMQHGNYSWKGFDGSEIIAHKLYNQYMTFRGTAAQKLQRYLNDYPDLDNRLFLWGIGNHGGGPSEEDFRAIEAFKKSISDVEIIHSTPEKYFNTVTNVTQQIDTSLRPSMVGCYTSMSRIKSQHRALENMLYSTEKMLSYAEAQGLIKYPKEQVAEAIEDLLFCEFHDILPGSCIQKAEEDALNMMAHGIELLSRQRAKAFFAAAVGQKKASDGEIPIFVYNPHPYRLVTIVECEYQLADQNYNANEFTGGDLFIDDKLIPLQFEKENSSLNHDWRKRIVFNAELEPAQMTRFDLKLNKLFNNDIDLSKEFSHFSRFSMPNEFLTQSKDLFVFDNFKMQVIINRKTGLVDRFAVNGMDLLKKNSFTPVVFESNQDPWGMRSNSYSNIVGKFKLLPSKIGSDLSGIFDKDVESVRIIENGEVRVVIQAVFGYEQSTAVVEYKLQSNGTEIEYAIDLVWNQPDKMLKIEIPTKLPKSAFLGQTAFGREHLEKDGSEQTAQKWTALQGKIGSLAVVNEGIYGFSAKAGDMYVNLLHSPGYAAHPEWPFGSRIVMPNDRSMPRIDIGSRSFNFILCGFEGALPEELELTALVYNEKPMALSFFPSGVGNLPVPVAEITDKAVIMSAFKPSVDGKGYIIRLFESTGIRRRAILKLPLWGIEKEIKLGKFEILTFLIDPIKRTLTNCLLTEEVI